MKTTRQTRWIRMQLKHHRFTQWLPSESSSHQGRQQWTQALTQVCPQDSLKATQKTIVRTWFPITLRRIATPKIMESVSYSVMVPSSMARLSSLVMESFTSPTETSIGVIGTMIRGLALEKCNGKMETYMKETGIMTPCGGKVFIYPRVETATQVTFWMVWSLAMESWSTLTRTSMKEPGRMTWFQRPMVNFGLPMETITQVKFRRDFSREKAV